MKLFLNVVLSFTVLLLCGCTGQWTDDSKNWKRAFGDKPPKDVTVVHSFYRRSKYLPREEDWAFELKLPPERRKLMFKNLGLGVPDKDDKWVIELLTNNPAPWFLPKPMTNYDIWISVKDTGVFFGAFEDKESTNVFVVGVGL